MKIRYLAFLIILPALGVQGAKVCVTIDNPNNPNGVERNCWETDDIDNDWQNWGEAPVRIYQEIFMPEPDASGGIDYASAYPTTETRHEGRFNEADVGSSCTTTTGTPGIVRPLIIYTSIGAIPIPFYLCYEDIDGDGIINFDDDCPFEATNTGDCMNDLPDCSLIHGSIIAMGGSGTSLVGSAVKVTATTKAGVAVGGFMVAWLAPAIVLAGATYCTVSWFENGEWHADDDDDD